MATVKKNTSAGNNVSINQGTSGSTNISVGGKVTINGTEHECINNTKFYPKGEYHKMENMKTTIANQAHYIQEQELNDKQRTAQKSAVLAQQAQQGYYVNQQQQQGGNWGQPYTDPYHNPWSRKETYEDWLTRLNKEKKSKEPQDPVDDEIVDSMNDAIHDIQKSTRQLIQNLAEINRREADLTRRESEIKFQERTIKSLQEKDIEAHHDICARLEQVKQMEKELEDLELNLVERAAVIEQWEKLHATPNTASGTPNDVRKRASRL